MTKPVLPSTFLTELAAGDDPVGGLAQVDRADTGVGPLAAVLWDMDGTIVDTEGYWMVAETELVTAHGGNWTPQDAIGMVGIGLDDAAEILKSRGVKLSTRELIDWLTDRVLEQVGVAVPWRPGARELLAALREAGIPTALVTMSEHRMAETIVSAIGFPAFTVIVGGDDVSAAKPDPEPYLHAARLLGVDISQCIAIEDSVPGLTSAIASGAVSLGVPAHVVLTPGPAHSLWPTLAGTSVEDLLSLFAERTSQRLHASTVRPEITPENSKDARS